MILSILEINLIIKTSTKLFLEDNYTQSQYVYFEEVQEIQKLLKEAQNKFEFCTALDTLNCMYSMILSEVRQKKREVVTAIFQQKPKLSEEKSVLEKKLDAEPEYAKYKEKEERLFNFINYLNNIKNNVTWLIKEEENE